MVKGIYSTYAYLFLVSAWTLAVIPAARAGGKGDVPSHFHRDIRVDGKVTDWPSGYFMLNSESKMLYAFANDSNYLYLCLETADETVMRGIFREGIRLYLDPDGKKKKNIEIWFPIGPPFMPTSQNMVTAGSSPGAPTENTGTVRPGTPAETGPRPGMTSIRRIPFSAKGLISDTAGIMIFGSVDSTLTLIFEASIPLTSFIVTPGGPRDIMAGISLELPASGSPGEGPSGNDPAGHHQGGGKGGASPSMAAQGGGMTGNQGPGMGMGGGQGDGMGDKMRGGPGVGPGGGPDRQASSTTGIKFWYRYRVGF